MVDDPGYILLAVGGGGRCFVEIKAHERIKHTNIETVVKTVFLASFSGTVYFYTRCFA